MFETRELDTKAIGREVVASVRTDTGCVREANEDNGRHIVPDDPEVKQRRGTLTIVADGMGGHASGEVASRMAVEITSEYYYATEGEPAEALRYAIETANTAIYQASNADEKLFGMGTTFVALVIIGDTAFSAHVGDSRLYRSRGGVLKMLTMDHSQVMEMVKHGILSLDEARNHEDKNVILRAVGTQAGVDVEVSEPFRVEIGDLFLLCSDGLSDMVTDGVIEAILRSESDVHSACEKLIEAAKKSGGHDNITAGLIRIDAEQDGAPVSAVRSTREVKV
ncbi:MAG: Stp1/IreP family PP2C-type Ser/Thr phosphatase [Acidobacteria bacterium]|nr:Stp1/IreP family PP2C-type Ser/Thr phosphatase [Acidobacteriota bacterium]